MTDNKAHSGAADQQEAKPANCEMAALPVGPQDRMWTPHLGLSRSSAMRSLGQLCLFFHLQSEGDNNTYLTELRGLNEILHQMLRIEPGTHEILNK